MCLQQIKKNQSKRNFKTLQSAKSHGSSRSGSMAKKRVGSYRVSKKAKREFYEKKMHLPSSSPVGATDERFGQNLKTRDLVVSEPQIDEQHMTEEEVKNQISSAKMRQLMGIPVSARNCKPCVKRELINLDFPASDG